jgi:hypothetical protein
MTDFTWTPVQYGYTADPDQINALGAQVQELTRKTGQAAYSFTASSAIGTTTTIILTISGCIIKAGRAYQVENIGGTFGDVAGRLADFSVWKNGTGGTQIGAFYRTNVGGPGQQTNTYGKIYIRRTAPTDLVFDMGLGVAANTGTVTPDAFTNRPRALVVQDVGAAELYPYAFDVT